MMKPNIKKKKKVWNTEDRQFISWKEIACCGKCDKSLNPYWKFCPYCGEVIEREKKNETN